MDKRQTMDLTGKLLIAMPGMGDPRFEAAVILICVHSAKGAMGLTINRPARNVSFAALLKQLKIPQGADPRAIRVHFGGPVERARGFVLHSGEYGAGEGTIRIAGGYGLTTTQDVLSDLGRDAGPREALLALGYAGWGPGQIEAEILRNDWLTSDAPAELVFSGSDEGKWVGALRHMGVDPMALSSTAGRA